VSNTYLNISDITRESLRVLHEKLSFIGTIDRQYDDRFAQSGAKIGSTLAIRKPVKYTVRTGKTMDVQDATETSVTLSLATQKGVDMGQFSSADMALKIDDFSKRFIEPAMAVLASDIEYTVLSGVTKQVYNLVGTAGTVPNSMSVFGNARARLNQYLAPKDRNRNVQISSVTMASMVDVYKGLFAPGENIGDQYLEGLVSRNSGLNWYENDRVYSHTNGTDHSGITLDNDTLVNGDTSCTITGCSSAPTEGTVFTFANVYAVHPETKQAYTHLQQFVVGSGSTTTNLVFSPAIYSSGANQNVNAMPSTTAALTFHGSASTSYEQGLAYHKDAFAFVTADLPLPRGMHDAYRVQKDGISMRVVSGYDMVNDIFATRVDVLFGYLATRPELACRISS